MPPTMKVYIIAATEGQYQDALRILGLHPRAAVHVTELRAAVDGPVYEFRGGQLVAIYAPPLVLSQRAA